MNTRAALLAQRIEEGAQALGAFAQGLSDAQWRAAAPPDGRPAGVIIHHVEIHYRSDLGRGG